MMEYLDQLHVYFGVEIPDETEWICSVTVG
jgi:hypothetical protein